MFNSDFFIVIIIIISFTSSLPSEIVRLNEVTHLNIVSLGKMCYENTGIHENMDHILLQL